jgi:lipopolysaccharide biosynthesis glycosyltransferase
MKILFTTVCNDKYAVGAQVMLYSMKKNIKGFDDCDVKFFHSPGIASLSKSNQEKIKRIAPNTQFQSVDPSPYWPAKIPAGGNRAKECKSAYLTLESFRETEYDKVILFDIDMLCVGDISELFEYDVQYGQVGVNTGLVVLGKMFRTEDVYRDLINMIPDHNGDGMDQGVLNKYFWGKEDPIPKKFNQYPLYDMTEDSRIIHWAHHDHIKPWAVNEWKDKVELFIGSGPGYKYPDVTVGNVPNAECKPAFDLWDQYYNEIKHIIEE